jgi:polysaccharide export outer membrane protein
MRILICGLLICVSFRPVLCAEAQARPAATVEPGSNLPAQRIGPNDLLYLSVYDAPELSRTFRVGADGVIRIPMLKQSVKAEGRMPAELEAAVADALRDEQILVDPVVTITVAEYHSRPISVAGGVKQPLTFQADGPVTLLEALTRAGGLGPESGSEILVSRSLPGGDGSRVLVQRISVRGLIDAADPKLNIRLTGGEEIRVPEAGRIYVVGKVKKPGVFALQDGGESTVLKALALAEGVEPFAAKQAYIYRREAGPAGTRNEIPIELTKILQRKAPDATLVANDVLYVPDNSGRRVGVAALEKFLLFATGATTAAIYGTMR